MEDPGFILFDYDCPGLNLSVGSSCLCPREGFKFKCKTNIWDYEQMKMRTKSSMVSTALCLSPDRLTVQGELLGLKQIHTELWEASSGDSVVALLFSFSPAFSSTPAIEG